MFRARYFKIIPTEMEQPLAKPGHGIPAQYLREEAMVAIKESLAVLGKSLAKDIKREKEIDPDAEHVTEMQRFKERIREFLQ